MIAGDGQKRCRDISNRHKEAATVSTKGTCTTTWIHTNIAKTAKNSERIAASTKNIWMNESLHELLLKLIHDIERNPHSYRRVQLLQKLDHIEIDRATSSGSMQQGTDFCCRAAGVSAE